MPKLAGDHLRDRVAGLLRVKFQTVEVEKRLNTTTADVFFVDDTSPIFPRRIAVEAKDWSKGLTSADIASIHTLYAPALSQRTIDNLWIIGKHQLSGSPRASVASLTNVQYSTFEEFRASLMNFTALLNHNILAFEQSDASKFFVDTRVRNSDKKLFDYVMKWMELNRSGLVVFGGYGLGKTTFSLYVASILSKRYLDGTFDRIPIRIPLGGMYSKQDVVALICSALSGAESGVSVKDFSYTMFLEMSQQGQYLLILDGFDEMRHAMDLEDFVYTFEQMKPLFSGKAKVIILGRPDSFLSNQEEEKILSSLFDGDSERQKRLQTVDVAFFNGQETEAYLGNFLSKKKPPLSKEQHAKYTSLLRQLPDSDANILLRPVQLKMFTSIIDELLDLDAPLTRYELYRKFIYGFIVRESRKWARQPPAEVLNSKSLRDDRMTFMQWMAWWLLNTKKENRFYAEEIPIEIIPAGMRVKQNNNAAIREALVGSVIEPVNQSGVLNNKAKRFYYFPHKSYLEFLVADYFENARFRRDDYRDFMSNVNAEILSFIEEGPGGGISNLREGLMHDLGVVDARILEVCAKDKKIASEVGDTRRGNRHQSNIYAHYFYLRKNGLDTEPYLLARLSDSITLNSVLATYNCIANETRISGRTTLVKAILASAITGISHHKIRNYLESSQPIEFYQADIEALRASVLSSCVKYQHPKKQFRFSISALLVLIERAARGSMFVHLPDSGYQLEEMRFLANEILETIGAHSAVLTSLLNKGGANGIIIAVSLRGDAAERFD
ncbi:hypothetical protein HNR60_003176 [Rhodopseudomonas rhenobacensis]|uniref:NACHT domain-containing protein n=1 Tax=Rhodopseudomonas rhenobacensis TaxID=87461 RepID=A0A7W8DZZ3_9BRAD|nr:NACHT domain-containing protein [Rhodopseudomonas rhenobacensis]MBB5048410.1 hypothetical protein [Rhodopseudomonas rhenobacensis]